ncbi:MAG: FAD:protein FMN transferase [Fibrobacterales bacterium]
MIKKITILGIALLTIIGMQYYFRSQRPLPSEYTWHKHHFTNLYTQINLTHHTSLSTDSLVYDSLVSTFTTFTEQVQANSSLDSMVFYADSGAQIPLSPVLFELFAYGLTTFTQTDGAINVGIGNLLREYGLLWNMTPHLPSDSSIHYLVDKMSTPFYRLDSATQSMIIERTGEHFALGSFSKGKALDLAESIFSHFNIEHYLLEVGGDIIYKGQNPKNRSWTVGIQDPNSPDGLKAALSLSHPKLNSMATSGGYEKYFVDATDTKHHHIINPKTGYSITDKKSVSVVSQGGMSTDFWATYLFILPVDSAIALVEKIESLEAIIITANDSMSISSGLVHNVTPLTK